MISQLPFHKQCKKYNRKLKYRKLHLTCMYLLFLKMPRELLLIIVYLWKTKTKLTSNFVQFDGAEWDVHGVGEERVLAVDFDSVEVLSDAGIPGVWSLMLVPLHHLCERTNQIQRHRIWLTYWNDSVLIILLLFIQSGLQSQSNTKETEKNLFFDLSAG